MVIIYFIYNDNIFLQQKNLFIFLITLNLKIFDNILIFEDVIYILCLLIYID
jgi:hypothetical protein